MLLPMWPSVLCAVTLLWTFLHSLLSVYLCARYWLSGRSPPGIVPSPFSGMSSFALLTTAISDSQLRKQGRVVSLTVHRAGKWQGWTLTRSTSAQAQVSSHQQLSPSPGIFSPNLYQFCRAPCTMALTSTEVSLLAWQISVVLQCLPGTSLDTDKIMRSKQSSCL